MSLFSSDYLIFFSLAGGFPINYSSPLTRCIGLWNYVFFLTGVTLNILVFIASVSMDISPSETNR